MTTALKVFIFLSILVEGCMNDNIEISEVQRKEIFKQVNSENSYIEILGSKSDSKGILYGSYSKIDENEKIYFKGIIEKLVVKEDNIKFTVQLFSFSKKSFFSAENMVQTDLLPIDSIPFEYRIPLKYFGQRKLDSLVLKKITEFDDSRSETVIFVKNK
jgi:hypothetical protein